MIRSLKLPKAFSAITVPPAVQKYFRPMLLASVLLHAFVLMAPLPSQTVKPIAVEKKQKTVKLASLPTLRKSTVSVAKPRAVARTLPQTRAILPQRGLTVPRPLQKRAAVAPAKSKPPVAQPSTRPSPQAAANSAASNSNASPQGGDGPMSDFPHYPGAAAGCLGLPSCFSASSPFADIAQYFEKELPLKKYTIQPSISEADRKVYQVSKGGASQYLTVLADGTTTEYVLAAEPQTQGSLRNSVQIPADFTTSILAQLPTNSGSEAGATGDVTPEMFSSPEKFFESLGGVGADGFDVSPKQSPEIDSIKVVSSQTPQQVYDSSFSAALSSAGYQATPVAAGFGGGLLYEIKKGSFKPFYLNLVPMKSGTGTLVVVWLSKPA
jgi:hypothetical protein